MDAIWWFMGGGCSLTMLLAVVWDVVYAHVDYAHRTLAWHVGAMGVVWGILV